MARENAYYAKLEQDWVQALKYFAGNYFEAILSQIQIDLSSSFP